LTISSVAVFVLHLHINKRDKVREIEVENIIFIIFSQGRRQRQKLVVPLLLGSQSRFWKSKSTFGGSVKEGL